ncbi:unnamed protein product [Kuraishia capsulata CBS 1993]|uniref:Homeobox domain-containing protein n=1 Tax=Kuraishia capsulata CBS 1993 TaxID=1382522 RepID=W6MUN7_9ASCO|nr:uncharacterized protein KUCA_T00001760001 [Kuraishia capsulata CBS 1993]CDK25790.1 unnamed protein product [Kuraishia capsulata CBS 1993]
MRVIDGTYNDFVRCSIKYLLNKGNTCSAAVIMKEEDQSEEYESMHALERYLEDLISALTGASSHKDNLPVVEEELYEQMTLLSHLSRKTVISTQERLILSNINRLSNCILFLLTESRALKRAVETIIEETKSDEAMEPSTGIQPQLVFDMLTPSMAANSDGTYISQRGRRLPASSVKILKEWYQCNIDKPYLSNEIVHHLMEKTGFSYSQVRNW